MASTASQATVAVHGRRTVLEKTPVRIATLALLFTAYAIYEAFHITAFRNGEIWWHLRTGSWILENHVTPHLGVFSRISSASWIDTSWLFDLIAGVTNSLLGLRGVPVMLMGFRVALASVAFLLAKGDRGNFWGAILLSAVAQYVIVDLQPVPGVLSILLFGIELIVLLKSRRSGDLRPLLMLPPLFVLWANVHVQFVVGLGLLALFLFTEIVERALQNAGVSGVKPSTIPVVKVAAVCTCAALGTLITPYGWHLFSVALQESYSSLVFRHFADMSPLGFRHPEDFVFALLMMAAFFALGRQHSRDLFKWSLLAVLLLLAFRVHRDVSFAVMAAIAIIPGEGNGSSVDNIFATWKWQRPVTALLVMSIFLGGIVCVPSDQALMKAVGAVFPVRACDFIRANRSPEPLFNAYDWGGFLTWYLPEYPVAIDGRLNLYGPQNTENYFKLVAGAEPLEGDPIFNSSNTILLQQNSGMARALTTLPALREQFHIAYQDDTAVVLVRR